MVQDKCSGRRARAAGSGQVTASLYRNRHCGKAALQVRARG
jgi:hypothetical protein